MQPDNNNNDNSFEEIMTHKEIKRVLRKHGLSRLDIEAEGWKTFKSTRSNVDLFQRLVRLAAVNNLMIKQGLDPLYTPPETVSDSEIDEPATVTAAGDAAAAAAVVVVADVPAAETGDNSAATQEVSEKTAAEAAEREAIHAKELQIAADIGLSPDEHSMVRGDYGRVCGLMVARGVYSILFRRAMKKRASITTESQVRTLLKQYAEHKLQMRGQTRNAFLLTLGLKPMAGRAYKSISSSLSKHRLRQQQQQTRKNNTHSGDTTTSDIFTLVS